MTFDPFTRRKFLQHGAAAAGAVSGLCGGGSLVDAVAGDTAADMALQAVACSRVEAAEAARDVLKQGGNAIDAAVAALVVQCVIEPSNVGLGGYGGSLVYYEAATGRVHVIDFDSRAPRRFDPATFTEASGMHGYLAVGTPGIVAGIDLALRRFGTLPFKTLAKSALDLAENGSTVTPRVAQSMTKLLDSIDPVSRRAFLPNGALAEGATWVQPDLARLIRRLGDEGLESFYTGDIARQIVRQVQTHGGALAEEDFHEFRATEPEPLHITYRGHDLYTPPLPSGGLTSLSILKTLEQFDVPKMAPWGAEYVELFAGASNLAWQERFQCIGDPEFVDVPVEELLSEKRAVARAEQLRKGTPTPGSQPDSATHTVNLVVADRKRNVVSWTATHGADYGAHVAIEGLGLMLGHGMSRFSATPGDPNFPAPRKRPQHNMSPLVVLKDGKPYAGLGLPGGRMIVTVTAQLAVSLIDFGASPQEIVTAPRIHTEGEMPIQVTTTLPQEVVEELRRKGHEVVVKESLGAGANAIVIEGGDMQAAATQGPSGALVF
jgi:gamma-glutamyltranspeptidase/glutathione hydrolase